MFSVMSTQAEPPALDFPGFVVNPSGTGAEPRLTDDPHPRIHISAPTSWPPTLVCQPCKAQQAERRPPRAKTQTALVMQAEPPPLEGVFAVNPEPPDAEPAHEPVEEKPDIKPPQPVSKWTLGDYDEPADDKWVSGTYIPIYRKFYMYICRKRVQ